jgi:hypothetical protein
MHKTSVTHLKKGLKLAISFAVGNAPPPEPLSKLNFQLPNEHRQCTALLQHTNNNKVAAKSFVELHRGKFCSALLPAAEYQNRVYISTYCHTVKLNAH